MVDVSSERLYLAKRCKDGGQDIFVDRCPTVQHQLDGIRYIYRAWKKKKPGVILNDPSGYGKRVQTALFLSAVLPTLAKPVLILCREGSENKWMSCFQQWTNISNDVSIELTNPFAKKKVLISATYAAAAFGKREWSVLVVDYDLISKDIHKSSLRTDLVIWITSSAVKEDLTKFSSFHLLVHPKAKFNADKFKANNNDVNDVLVKTAMLDAFLEDIVLRRVLVETPFPQYQISDNSTVVPRITKKNKDSTGTKIKRTKRKSVESTPNIPNKVAKTTINNTPENNSEVFEIGNLDNSKVHTNTTAVAENLKIGDDSDLSDEEQFAPRNSKSKKTQKIWDSDGEDGDDGDDVEATKAQTNENQCMENSSELDESGEQLRVLRWDSETDSDNDLVIVETKGLNLDVGKSKMGKPESPTVNQIPIAEDLKDLENSGSLLINNENHIKSGLKNSVDTEIVNEIDPIKKFSEDLFSTDFTTNNEVNATKNMCETENVDEKLPANNLKSSNENGSTKKQDEPDQSKTLENANLSSFDIKMKELEESALKKYKGSFLDRIF